MSSTRGLVDMICLWISLGRLAPLAMAFIILRKAKDKGYEQEEVALLIKVIAS